jgi:5S rRNA maturation endonuclease (ribonuclease M5)
MNYAEEHASDPHVQLANAIIVQAVRDYRDARKIMARKHHATTNKRIWAERQIANCQRFSLSDWFKVLTDIDGEMLIRKLDEEMDSSEKLSKKRGISQMHHGGKAKI